MLRIPFPFIDWALVLTPPFESMPVWLQFVLAFFGLGLSAALLIWLYSYEMQLIHRAKALGLLALRALALLLLWFICLQPVISRPASERISGRVIIALDRSDSMSVA